jgi:purine-binding chemotaxis protein CheW
MDASESLVIGTVGEQRIALPLASVDRVVRAVAITLLPGAPDCVSGVINFRGRIIPVIDLRKRYGLPPREIELTDDMIIADASGRKIALLVDSTEMITCATDAKTPASEVVSGVASNLDVVKRDDGLAVLHSIHSLLSGEEQRAMDSAIDAKAGSNLEPVE